MMKQDKVSYTVLMQPSDRSHPCQYYIHHSFYPELEDALLEAQTAWALDHPNAAGETIFVCKGFGFDPRMGAPDPDDQSIFRN